MATADELRELATASEVEAVEAAQAVALAETAVVVVEAALALNEVVVAEANLQAAETAAEVVGDVEELENEQKWTSKQISELSALTTSNAEALLMLTDQVAAISLVLQSSPPTPTPEVLQTPEPGMTVILEPSADAASHKVPEVPARPEPARPNKRRLM